MNCYIPPYMALKLSKAIKNVLSEPMPQDEYESLQVLYQMFAHLGRATLAEERLMGYELASHESEVEAYGS